LTWADIAVANFFHEMRTRFGTDLMAQAKALETHVDKVFGLPNIKKWVETRPQSTM
jgi:hypothetical protein